MGAYLGVQKCFNKPLVDVAKAFNYSEDNILILLNDEEQLKKIIDDNNKGFEYEGKHYTNYEGEQMQRRMETAIREQKDIQILGRESNDMQMVDEAQKKIKILTNKYKEFSNASGLGTKMDRLRVTGYKRIKSAR